MASHSALTEEGRTRIRNFQGRVGSYLLLWAVIGVGVVIGGIFLRTRYGYLPLQRLYLSQYIKASIKSFIPSKRPSKYILLVRVVDEAAIRFWAALTTRYYPSEMRSVASDLIQNSARSSD